VGAQHQDKTGDVTEAAQVVLQSAKSQEVLASCRVGEADRRLHVAWDNYLKLYGIASSPDGSSQASAGPSVKGKGKGRASAPEDDSKDGEEEVVSRWLKDDGDDEEGPGAMDLS
jgi:hypothetical protein